MDSLSELEKAKNASLAINVNQVKVETEEERRQRLLEEERLEAERRKLAFAVDDEYIVNKRLAKMSADVSASTAGKRVNEMLKIIEGLLNNSKNYIFVTDREMAQRVLDIMSVYEAEIKALNSQDARNALIGRYKTKCENAIKQNNVAAQVIQRDQKIDSLSETIIKESEEKQAEVLDASVDNSLSAKTMEGVRSIDRWMLRHMHETGMSENDKFSFVSTLLRLSARERLYMYYVIEKGHRHKPMTSDVIESQLSYVPDKDTFTKRMKMSKARVFRRMANGSIYWSKLADAYGQLDFVRPTIKKYSKVNQDKTALTRTRKDKIVKAYIDANGGVDSAEKRQEITAEIKKRDRLIKDRDAALGEFRTALIDYKKKKKTSDSAWVNKTKKKNAADNAAANVYNKLQDMLNKDSEIGIIEKNLRNENADRINEHVKDDAGREIIEDGFDRIGDFAEVSENVVDNIGSPATAAYDTISEMAENAIKADSQFLGIGETSLAKLSLANVSALSVLTISSAINAVSTIIELKDNASGMMKGDVAAASIDLISTLASVFDSGFQAVVTGMDAVEALTATANAASKVADEITDAAEKMVETAGESIYTAENIIKFAGIGAASLGIIANTAIMANSAANSSYLSRSRRTLEEKRALDHQVPLSQEEEKKRLRKEKYEENMLKHQQRVLKDEKFSAAIGVINNIVLLGSAFSAGLLTPILSGVSIGFGVYSSIRLSIAGRREKTAAVDEFLGIAGYDNPNIEKAFEDYLDSKRTNRGGILARDNYNAMTDSQKAEYKKKVMDKLRIGIRNELMAKMGCATKTDFYNKIMEKYGNLVYDGAFVNGNAQITNIDDLDRPERVPYVNLIKSLGLKISITRDGIKPTRQAVIARMQR